MRILLTGARGQLGWELRRSLQPLGEVLAMTRDALDLRDHHGLRGHIHALRPDAVVNAAAFTAVDLAESNRDEAFAVNAAAVATMASACRDVDALLLHFSTDYVFDGAGGAPYAEDAVANPVNVYGESKLAGDLALAVAGCRYLLLRVSWIYSLRRRNFVRAVVDQARVGRPLRVVGDQRSAPTPAWLIADASAQLLGRALRAPPTSSPGLLNLSCAGDGSWHEFALAIFAHLGQRPALMRALGIPSIPPIDPVSTHEYATIARRPLDTRLTLDRLVAQGLYPMHWRDALAYTLDALLPADPPRPAAGAHPADGPPANMPPAGASTGAESA